MNKTTFGKFFPFSIFVGLGLLIVFLLWIFPQEYKLLTLLFIPGGLIFVYLIFMAIRGRPWALFLYLGLVVFFSDANFRGEQLIDRGIDLQSMLKLLIWIGALSIGIMHLRITRGLLLRLPVFYLFVFGIISILSVFYSPTPVYTLGATISLIGLLLFSASVAKQLTFRQIILCLAFFLMMFIVLSWVAYLFIPELGRSSNWVSLTGFNRIIGISGHENLLGQMSAITIFTLYVLYQKKYLSVPIVLICIVIASVTLLVSQSRTALLGLFMAFFFLFIRRWPGLVLPLLTIAVGGVYLLALFSNFIPIETYLIAFTRSGNLSELYTLTGRTQLWDFILVKITESPLIGYGYAASRELIPQEWAATNGWTTTQAHNMLLQSVFSVGIIGSIPLVLVFLKQIVQFSRKIHPFHDLVFIFILMVGIAENGPIGLAPTTLSMIWFLSIVSGGSVSRDAIRERGHESS